VAYVVWVPELGAEEKHVHGATRLASDPRAVHFWDPTEAVGRLYARRLFHTDGSRALWDFYMLFGRSARWEPGQPPPPDVWMHQLNVLDPAHRLDAAAYAADAARLLHEHH
jgi:hypothetical protein